MQIQVNTDSSIQGGEPLTRLVRDIVESAVDRFAARITRVEVHLTDENSGAKGGADDMRCVLEARVAGLKPVSVRHAAATIELACAGAADKLERALDSMLGRRDNPKGRTSFGGAEVG
jgi:hypothetical protein